MACSEYGRARVVPRRSALTKKVKAVANCSIGSTPVARDVRKGSRKGRAGGMS